MSYGHPECLSGLVMPSHKGPLVCRVFATPWSGSFVSMTGEQRSWLFKPTLDLLVGARWTLHGTSLHGSLDCGVLELAVDTWVTTS